MHYDQLPFQIFGSADSNDTDVMVYVGEIGQPHTSAATCKGITAFLKETYADRFAWATKELDVNLAINTGTIQKVYKGNSDEVNNSLIRTYDLHEQAYPLMVNYLVERDVTNKVLRSFRAMLSLISRTEFRTEVKRGLHGDVNVQLDVLENIPVSAIADLGSKNMSMLDYHKVVAFQLGQAIGLLKGQEHYTKAEISYYFPHLKPFLYREAGDMNALDTHQDKLLELVRDYVPFMYALQE